MKQPIRTLIMVFAAAVLMLSLSGCLISTYELTNEDKNIRYIAYTCAAPEDKDSFSFTLGEKDGECQFTAWCVYDNRMKIVLNGVTVDSSEMDALREIAEKHDLSNFVMTHLSTSIDERKDLSPDETVYSLRIMWENGESKLSDSAWLAADDLYDFFVGLARKYN